MAGPAGQAAASDDRPGKTTYLIGVDTGGTYTDAAVIEARGHRIIATAKAITTKGDLAVGVTEAITQALAKLSHDVPPQDVAMVSVSTTLATNAVVEGHGSATGVILIGFDAAMVERTGIAKAFPEIPMAVIDGGHNHNGDAARPLDLDALDAAILAMAPKVDAYAVAGAFAVRNAAHEQAARERIVALTGKPVTLSTELSSALDAPRRALTAVLNARLIPRISGLIGAVQRAMAHLKIACPLMIVKGDGSLALAESVATRPIETVLSGPAASLVGAQWLSGLDSFILSDMGGTTTDLGLLINGRPKVREEGAEVGGWRTMVRAIDVRTIGLGGDSEITLHANGRIQVGPQRVAPVSLIAARYPQVLAMLRADLDDVQGGGSMHGKFVLLPFAASTDKQHNGLSARELEALQTITHAPQPLRKLATSLSSQRSIASLQRKGLVQVSSLTPSDVSHVLGLQANWSLEAATMATQLAARLRDMKLPTPERTRNFASAVWNETVRLTGLAILQTAFGVEMADNALTQAVCSGAGQLGLATVRLTPSIPVVAVGGPVKVYYEEVQRRLGCEMVFPEFCEVANAVGAATGVVAHSATVEVLGDGSGLFRLHSTAGTRQFTDATEALAAAQALAEQLARDAVIEMGAPHPQVKLSVTKQYMPNARDDTGLLQATLVAEAIGRPNAAA
ncbi:hydantoinase [Rhodoferax lacus]|uniref:Hydantoinase n=1 Tax=Rhodoferax lacus TaxID=2184758 RepID=A0A3E1R766_9BURK|nr:hydantoinase/oxoprolinase family protein [Rhodoferax lacus]RFO95206.1 hydantoinase [Rhodoferax lacus]